MTTRTTPVWQFKTSENWSQIVINHKGKWMDSSKSFCNFVGGPHKDNIGRLASDVQDVKVVRTWRQGGEIEIIWKNGQVSGSSYGRSETTSVKGVMDNRHRNWRRRG